MAGYMGHDPYKTPFDVVQEAQAFLRGEKPKELDKMVVDIGNVTEPVILMRGLKAIGLEGCKIFHHKDKYGKECAKKHESLELYYSDDGLIEIEPSSPFIVSSDPQNNVFVLNDAERVTLFGKVVLEAKFTSTFRNKNLPPLHRGVIQLQVGMMCHDADFGILSVCHQGRDLCVYVFEKHPLTRDLISKSVASFEKHIKDGTFPESLTIDDAVKKHNFPSNEVEIELGQKFSQVLERLVEIPSNIKALEEEKKVLTKDIMNAMGNHETALGYDNQHNPIKVKWGVRNYKAKQAIKCEKCGHEIKPAIPAYTEREKTLRLKK